MTSSVRILTAASVDSGPSLIIVSPDGSKTLINCGEGCQRSFLESSSGSGSGSADGNGNVGALRVSSVNRICLTHVGHDAIGGLPGMMLTTADAVDAVAREVALAGKDGNGDRRRRSGDGGGDGGRNDRKRNGGPVPDGDGAPDLDVVGPEGTRCFLHSLRHFMRRDRFRVHSHEGRYDSSQDENGASAGFAAKKRAKRRRFKGSAAAEEMAFRVRSFPADYDTFDYPEDYDAADPSVRALPLTRRAVSYLFTTPPIPGKFLVERAQELNVPKGRLYGQLKAGKSVTFVDPDTGEERTVTSGEVVAESSPGVGVAVAYCPALEVLARLREEDAFRELEERPAGGDGDAGGRVTLEVMVHLTPRSVFRDPAYRRWCEGFGAGVDHVTLHAEEALEDRAAGEENSPFVAGMCGGIRRSFVHDGLFPMPLCTNLGGDDDDDRADKCDSEGLPVIDGCPLMEYVLMPRSRRGVNKATLKGLYRTDTIECLRKKANDSGAVRRAAAIKDSVCGEKNGGGSSGPGELIFTGTGSAVPCKHRNVTGIYLRMDNGNAMLLDVGEGTVGQLLRSWRSTLPSNGNAIEEYRSRLRGIKAVFISHPHADHHLGLPRLLSERAAVCGPNDPLVLMAPHDMFAFLEEYRWVAPEIEGSYIPVDCGDMVHGRRNPMGDRLYADLGITHCASIPVAHCQRSYAVAVEGTPFGSLAYSGDCRPSSRLADVARGTDLLIHEATFENGMEADATMKRHSTVGEAVGVARRMGAGALVLTHFSQRYPRVPPLDDGPGSGGGAGGEIPIAFAFDFMRITPGTLGLAARLTPALRLLYPREGGLEEPETTSGGVTAKELMAVPGVFAAKGVL